MTTPAGGGNRPSGSILVAIFLIVFLGIVVVGGSVTALQLPDPATEQARKIHSLYQVTLAISMIIFFGVTAGIIWAIFRLPQDAATTSLSRSTAAAPSSSAGRSSRSSSSSGSSSLPSSSDRPQDAARPPTRLTSRSRRSATSGGGSSCTVRKGTASVRTTCTSSARRQTTTTSSLRSWWCQSIRLSSRKCARRTSSTASSAPHTLYKIQAIPGNVNQMHFKVEKAGIYSGQCYQFCGLRHSDMLFVVSAVPDADYQSWLTEQRRAQGLDKAPTGGGHGTVTRIREDQAPGSRDTVVSRPDHARQRLFSTGQGGRRI